jgi:hypothetical protein
MAEQWQKQNTDDERRFSVVVKTNANPNWATEVYALDEWKARTRAMFGYPHPLSGDFVDYEVKEIN